MHLGYEWYLSYFLLKLKLKLHMKKHRMTSKTKKIMLFISCHLFNVSFVCYVSVMVLTLFSSVAYGQDQESGQEQGQEQGQEPSDSGAEEYVDIQEVTVPVSRSYLNLLIKNGQKSFFIDPMPNPESGDQLPVDGRGGSSGGPCDNPFLSDLNCPDPGSSDTTPETDDPGTPPVGLPIPPRDCAADKPFCTPSNPWIRTERDDNDRLRKWNPNLGNWRNPGELIIQTGQQRCGNASASSLYSSNPAIDYLTIEQRNIVGSRTVRSGGSGGSGESVVSRTAVAEIASDQQVNTRGGSVKFALVYWTSAQLAGASQGSKLVHPIHRMALPDSSSGLNRNVKITDIIDSFRETMRNYAIHVFRHSNGFGSSKYRVSTTHKPHLKPQKDNLVVLPPYNLKGKQYYRNKGQRSYSGNQHIAYINTIALGVTNANMGAVRFIAPPDMDKTGNHPKSDWLEEVLKNQVGFTQTQIDKLSDAQYNKWAVIAYWLKVFNQGSWGALRRTGSNQPKMVYTTHFAIQACRQFSVNSHPRVTLLTQAQNPSWMGSANKKVEDMGRLYSKDFRYRDVKSNPSMHLRADQVIQDLNDWASYPDLFKLSEYQQRVTSRQKLNAFLNQDAQTIGTMQSSEKDKLIKRLNKYSDLVMPQNYTTNVFPEAFGEKKSALSYFYKHLKRVADAIPTYTPPEGDQPVKDLVVERLKDYQGAGLSRLTQIQRDWIGSLHSLQTPRFLTKGIDPPVSCYALKEAFHRIDPSESNITPYTPKWWEHTDFGFTCKFLARLFRVAEYNSQQADADTRLNVQTFTWTLTKKRQAPGGLECTAGLPRFTELAESAKALSDDDWKKGKSPYYLKFTARENAIDIALKIQPRWGNTFYTLSNLNDGRLERRLDRVGATVDLIEKVLDGDEEGASVKGCYEFDAMKQAVKVHRQNEALMLKKSLEYYLEEVFAPAVIFDEIQINLALRPHFSVSCSGDALVDYLNTNRRSDLSKFKDAWGNVLSSAHLDLLDNTHNRGLSLLQTFDAKNPEGPFNLPPQNARTYTEGASYLTFNNSKVTANKINAADTASEREDGQDFEKIILGNVGGDNEGSALEFSKPMVYQPGEALPQPKIVYEADSLAVRSYPRAICQLVNVERIILQRVRHYNSSSN